MTFALVFVVAALAEPPSADNDCAALRRAAEAEPSSTGSTRQLARGFRDMANVWRAAEVHGEAQRALQERSAAALDRVADAWQRGEADPEEITRLIRSVEAQDEQLWKIAFDVTAYCITAPVPDCARVAELVEARPRVLLADIDRTGPARERLLAFRAELATVEGEGNIQLANALARMRLAYDELLASLDSADALTAPFQEMKDLAAELDRLCPASAR